MDTLNLTNGLSIETLAANYRTVRGYSFVAALLDELAFWRSDDGAANPDTEILAAIRPRWPQSHCDDDKGDAIRALSGALPRSSRGGVSNGRLTGSPCRDVPYIASVNPVTLTTPPGLLSRLPLFARTNIRWAFVCSAYRVAPREGARSNKIGTALPSCPPR
jgi:hypothetical protein